MASTMDLSLWRPLLPPGRNEALLAEVLTSRAEFSIAVVGV